MRFVFGDIEVDCEQIKLTKQNRLMECEPRVFELLVYFCHHPKEAVSREELVKEVWAGRVVSDAAINRAVGELRKLIEDTPKSPQWIKTVSKVGYRFTVTPSIFTESKENSSIKIAEIESVEESIKQSKAPFYTKKIPEINNILSGNWLLLCVVFILIIFIVLNIITSKTNTPNLEVVDSKPVTSTMGSAFNAAYNAEDNTLVFLFRSNANDYSQLYIQKGHSPAQAISDDDYYYTDVLYGTGDAIYASRLNNLQERHCEIVEVNMLTKRHMPIMNCGKGVVTHLAFDAKRNRIIYRSRPSISEPYAIHSYQLDTGRKQQLTHPVQIGNNTGDYSFSISPNSQKLAIVEYNGDAVDKIKLVDLTNNHVIESVAFLDHVYGLIWRTDTQILATNSEGLFEFTIANLAVNAVEKSDQFGRLTRGADKYSIFSEKSQTTINIFSYSKNKKDNKPLTRNSGISLTPVLGNTSNILAFISDRTGKQQIHIQPEGRGGFIAEFPEDIAYVSGMSWAPNDSALVASVNSRLYLYTVENQQWEKVAESFEQVHHVAFAQDALIFSAEVNGQWNIWQFHLPSKQTEQITTRGGYSVQGKDNIIYFTKYNHAGLYELDVDTGAESILIKNFPIAGWRHWQLRDNKIYYLLNKEYRVLDLESSINTALYNFEGRTPNSCNMSFNHAYFACEKVELSTSNIWQFKLSE